MSLRTLLTTLLLTFSCSVMAASADGSIGVVAAWSRYVMAPPE